MTTSQDEIKYSLDDPIGQGIFSTTYQASEANQGIPVIIKTLAPSLTQHPEYRRFRKRFLELASALARCQHPGLPKIWESFEEEGQPYLVYERVCGSTLAEKVNLDGPVSETQAIAWIRQVAEALQVLHANGLKHLDVQPRNIIINQDTGAAFLVDCCLTCELTPEIRQTHANLVAPGYAPLELYDPKLPSSTATDIYALSATFYFLVAGTAPPPAPLLRHIAADKWQQFPANLSVDTQKAILHGLAIEPGDRPQSLEVWLSVLLASEIERQKEAERQAQLEAERQAQLEAERQAQLEAERQAQLEAEHQAKLEAERQAKLEAERQIQLEAERQAKLEAERQAKLEAKNLSKLERQAKLEAERQAKLEAERQAKLEQQAKLEAEREAKRAAKSKQKEVKKETQKPQKRELGTKPTQKGKQKNTVPNSKSRPEQSETASKAKNKSVRFPVGALLMTSAIAASAGAGFGLSLRFNRPTEPGATFWHIEQSFPPREQNP